jgi:hypothetical protein
MWRSWWHTVQSLEVSDTSPSFLGLTTPVCGDPEESPHHLQLSASSWTCPPPVCTLAFLCFASVNQLLLQSSLGPSLNSCSHETRSSLNPWTQWPESSHKFWWAKPGDSRRPWIKSQWWFSDSGEPTWFLIIWAGWGGTFSFLLFHSGLLSCKNFTALKIYCSSLPWLERPNNPQFAFSILGCKHKVNMERLRALCSFSLLLPSCLH